LTVGKASVSVSSVVVSTLIEIAAAPVPAGAAGVYGRVERLFAVNLTARSGPTNC
jgi:hypothetical protein